MPSSNIRALELLKELRQRERFNRINSYDPYPYQKKFIRQEQTPISDC